MEPSARLLSETLESLLSRQGPLPTWCGAGSSGTPEMGKEAKAAYAAIKKASASTGGFVVAGAHSSFAFSATLSGSEAIGLISAESGQALAGVTVRRFRGAAGVEYSTELGEESTPFGIRVLAAAIAAAARGADTVS